MLGLTEFQKALLDKLIAGFPADTLLDAAERIESSALDFRSQLNPIHLARRLESRRFTISEDHAYWMLSLRRRLRRHRNAVEYYEKISGSVFYDEFYCQNRPIFVRHFFEDRSERGQLTFDSLRSDHGNVVVSVMRGRSIEPRFSANERRFLEEVTLRDYIDEVQRGPSDDHYLTGDGGAVLGPLIVSASRLVPPSDVIRPASSEECSLWLGPTGAFTPFHYDVSNVFIMQAIGRKRVFLVPPYDSQYMYDDSSRRFSQVDPRKPDLESFPLYKHATVSEVLLEPGAGLFIPVGWWHAVETTESSFSVTLTGFHRLNSFPRTVL